MRIIFDQSTASDTVKMLLPWYWENISPSVHLTSLTARLMPMTSFSPIQPFLYKYSDTLTFLQLGAVQLHNDLDCDLFFMALKQCTKMEALSMTVIVNFIRVKAVSADLVDTVKVRVCVCVIINT
jgi:hypothetical protein